MMNSAGEPADPGKPTRQRYGVLGFACALAAIVYMDRACIASAQADIVHDLGLKSVADLGCVFAAFSLAYALFEVPNGWLGDTFGPRRVLIRIALWWSVFIALTAVVGLKLGGTVLGGVGLLVVIQFLFGAGEAGAFPNITRALHNWFPIEQRGFAQGAVWMCGRMMGGLTPLIWMFVMSGLRHAVPESTSQAAAPLLAPWRIAFLLVGLVGISWCLCFALWFRDRPEQKPGVNAAELAWIRSGGAPPAAAHGRVPWLRILTSGNLWLLCVMYGCQSYGWYFYITYLPQFCEAVEQHGNTPSTPIVAALFKGGPLWMGAIGCLVGGFLTDWFIRRTGNRRLGRRLFGAVGHALTAIAFLTCFCICAAGRGVSSIFFIIMAAGFCTDLTMGSAWALCQDIGKRYSAIVAGLMNMIGNLGGTLANLVSGYVLARALDAHAAALNIGVRELLPAEKNVGQMPGYQTIFLIAAGMYTIGFLCWLRVDATRPVVPEEP